ncbi:MAG: PD-(D/E)XK nuclease family protein [Aerococcus sp.]|nr:PD-(D/E)XK nuclease family protein [Aerococcus sp.]
MALILNLETAMQTHRRAVIAEVDHFLMEDRNNKAFYIVPDNQQLTMEFEVLNTLRELHALSPDQPTGMMRLQVFSFKRFAWYLGIKSKDSISKIGLTMVIKKVLEDLESELKAFQRESHFLSFQEQLRELFAEFDRGNMTVDYLKALLDRLKSDNHIENSTFKQNEIRKLSEIIAAFEDYNNYLEDQKLQDIDIYEELIRKIIANDLSHTMVVIDGFDYFKADEYRVIKCLIDNANQVILSLLAESKDIDQTDAYDPNQSTFTNAHYIYSQLTDLLGERSDIQSFNVSESENSYCEGIQMLEEWWRKQEFGEVEVNESVQDAVSIWKTESLRVEADQAASAIYNQVSQKKYRYKDFQIFVGDLDHYQPLLIGALEQNGIPYYIDNPESMAQHPLARFLAALHNVIKYDWRYEDVFSLLKTELLSPRFMGQVEDEENGDTKMVPKHPRSVLDRIENIVLAQDYQGRLWWKQGEDWYRPNSGKADNAKQKVLQTDDRVIKFRDKVYESINDLIHSWNKETTVEHAVRSFYEFIDGEDSVRARMQAWSSYLTNSEDVKDDPRSVELAQRQEQVWNLFVQTLEEYVELFGKETFDMDSFFEVMQAAFANNYYRMVPPTLDSVRISTYKDVPLIPRKVSIILGITDQQLPKNETTHSILDDTTREWLNDLMHSEKLLETSDQEIHFLDPNAQQKYNNEKFTFYKLLTSATDHLIFSYPYNAPDANEKISPFLAVLMDHFELESPLHAEQFVEADSEWILGGPYEQLQQLTIKKQQFEELPTEWKKVDAQISNSHRDEKNSNQQLTKDWNELIEKLKHTGNQFINLDTKEAKSLYGEIPTFSISQLELYNKDPFSYFLRYGLKLKERQKFEVDALQTGNYFHKALELYFKNWPDVSEEKMNEALAETVKEFDVFNRSKDHQDFQFRRQQLDETLQLVARYETLRLQAMNAEKIITEQQFETETRKTDKDNSYRLKGKIDRVDLFKIPASDETPEKLGFQIVDYKSSDNKDKLPLKRLEDGISLQLFTYFVREWEELEKTDNNIVPIGFFYQEISDLMSSNKDINIKNDSEYLANNHAMEGLLTQAQRVQFTGTILNDIDLLNSIFSEELKDRISLEDIYDVTITSKGFKKPSANHRKKLLEDGEFKLIKEMVHLKINETIDRIMSGEIALLPLDFEINHLPSAKEYRAISRYDATESDIHKRAPSNDTDKNILKSFKLEDKEDGNE